ncbi:MAG: biotin--[acetyl-CoA-carboxylase] ligase [Thermovirgaceae bacterium]|nr:biotin--[acetyl-CoA-carboxylase] ligase [Thermovirgaceae bacterium]
MPTQKFSSTKIEVLRELIDSQGDTVSGGRLCRALGLSRQSVWKAVRSLQEDGYRIGSIPVKGYRFQGAPDNDLDPSWIEILLSDCPWGHPVLYWEKLDSTQIPAKDLARRGALEGVVILANCQTSGRGRLGRTWISPPEGGIYFSVIIRPSVKPDQIQTLSLVSAIAVQDAILSRCGVRCQLKWPNDILWKDSKVCGILSEVSSEPGMVHYAVTGIGINANMAVKPMGLEGSATSLASIVGRKIHRGEVVASVIRQFHQWVVRMETGSGVKEIISEYASRCDTIGKMVRVVLDEGEITGRACGIDERGNLLVDAGGEMRSFSAADITHLRTIS